MIAEHPDRYVAGCSCAACQWDAMALEEALRKTRTALFRRYVDLGDPVDLRMAGVAQNDLARVAQ